MNSKEVRIRAYVDGRMYLPYPVHYYCQLKNTPQCGGTCYYNDHINHWCPHLGDALTIFSDTVLDGTTIIVNEMAVLVDMLESAHIPHEVIKDSYGCDQVVYPSKHNCVCDAICHEFSFGYEKGLLEISGLLTPEEMEMDGVVGWLTAEEVFDRILNHYEETKSESNLK